MLMTNQVSAFGDWQWVFPAHSAGHENRLAVGQAAGLSLTHGQLKLELAWTAFQEGHEQPWVAAPFTLSPPLALAASMTFVGPGHFTFDSGMGFLANVYGPFHKRRVSPEEVQGLARAASSS